MTTDNYFAPELNRVYLPYYGFFKEYDFHGRKGAFRDVTSFEFIVEALIAQSASQIALLSWGKEVDRSLLENVPPTLRKRIIFIDRDRSALNLAISVLSPAFTEFSIEADKYALTFKKSPPDRVLGEAIAETYFSLHDFLLGLKNKLQVDINIEDLKKSVSLIRCRSENPESRANMAILEGIFNSYKQDTVGAIQIVPHGGKKQTELFINFLEDTSFEELSRATHGLGFPLLFRKSAVQIKQTLRKIVASERFAQIVAASSKPISAVTKIPLPSPELVKMFEFSDYLPPIVSLKPTLEQAYTGWDTILKDKNLTERYQKSMFHPKHPTKM